MKMDEMLLVTLMTGTFTHSATLLHIGSVHLMALNSSVSSPVLAEEPSLQLFSFSLVLANDVLWI